MRGRDRSVMTVRTVSARLTSPSRGQAFEGAIAVRDFQGRTPWLP